MKPFITIAFLALSTFLFSQEDIFTAVRKNDTLSIQSFLKSGSNINEQDIKGFTPLILAVYLGNYEASEFLLRHGAQTDLKDYSGNTALMGAAFKGHYRLCELLLMYNANPNALNLNNANALFFAVTFGQNDIAKLLIQHGTNLNQLDSFGKSVLDHAFMQENDVLIGAIEDAAAVK
jgi:ankyrin repeat protein